MPGILLKCLYLLEDDVLAMYLLLYGVYQTLIPFRHEHRAVNTCQSRNSLQIASRSWAGVRRRDHILRGRRVTVVFLDADSDSGELLQVARDGLLPGSGSLFFEPLLFHK